LDEAGGDEETAVDKILELHRSVPDLRLLLPHSVRTEIEHPNTPVEVKRRASRLLYTEPVNLTEPERARHNAIRNLIQGNARPGLHDMDAIHLVESAKYGGYFITSDGRLLKKAGEIRSILGLEIVTPREFLTAYLTHKTTNP
jgi:hypothetical protein